MVLGRDPYGILRSTQLRSPRNWQDWPPSTLRIEIDSYATARAYVNMHNVRRDVSVDLSYVWHVVVERRRQLAACCTPTRPPFVSHAILLCFGPGNWGTSDPLYLSLPLPAPGPQSTHCTHGCDSEV